MSLLGVYCLPRNKPLWNDDMRSLGIILTAFLITTSDDRNFLELLQNKYIGILWFGEMLQSKSYCYRQWIASTIQNELLRILPEFMNCSSGFPKMIWLSCAKLLILLWVLILPRNFYSQFESTSKWNLNFLWVSMTFLFPQDENQFTTWCSKMLAW